MYISEIEAREEVDMKIVKCKFLAIDDAVAGFRLRLRLLENHPNAPAKAGEYVTTSAVKMIDFKRGFALTRNNIYKWK